jgi:glycosyltransferase involved in cell wall biosynthesis
MVSSVATAYPYRHDKLSVIGQGIDTALFAPTDTVPEEPPVILCTGRLSPVKGHSVLLRTAALLRERRQRPFRVVIVGGPAGPQDASYVQSLHVQRQQLGIDDLVTFSPPVTMSALPVWYQRATIVVNLTPTGFGDKVAWEALSCGRPCVAANEGFRDTFGQYADALCFRHGDAEDLADKLTTLLARPQQELAQMGAYLRQQVVRMHDIERLANRLLEVLQQVSGSPARPQQPNWLGRDASLSHFAE